MKQIKPDFYDRFVCIADRCDFTCCQEWKIAVDETTNRSWKTMTPPPGVKSRRKNLSQFTQFKDQGRVIALENHVCPFLDDRRLCRLVIAYGPGSISHTCQIFPREIHTFADRTEYTLMPCCPAVIDLMDQAEDFRLVEAEEEGQTSPLPEEDSELPALRRIRSLYLDYAREAAITAEEAQLACFFLALGFLEEGTEAGMDHLPRREELIAAIRENSRDPEDTFTECNELFLDLIDNYRKQGMYAAWLEAPAELADRISSGDRESGTYEEPGFSEAWISFAPLMRKWLIQEIYADLLLSDSDTETMAMKLEWIAMEYTAIRHLFWLTYTLKAGADYTDLRNSIVLISRMMGYEEEDIEEYLENSFEDAIFSWSYLARIL